MREYILTEKERREIERYFRDGNATNLIYVLRSRGLKALERLREDLEFLEKLIGYE